MISKLVVRLPNNQMIKRLKIQNGFTLVELLVVIAIISILVTIGLVAFTSSQMRGRDAARKSDLKQIANGLEIFYTDYGKYPPSDGTNSTGQIYACPFDSVKLTGTACTWGSSEFNDIDSSGSTKTLYMKTLPKDPVSSYTYWYRVDSTGQKYQVFAHLENTQDPSLISTPYMCGTGAACNFGTSSPNSSPTDTSW